MESTVEQSPEYQAARRQVQRLRGFYAHLAVYLPVNAGLLVQTIQDVQSARQAIW